MAETSQSPERKELKAGWKNEVEVKTYKKKDVSMHNSRQDLWIIVHGKVYDVTKYARDHPGGLDTLLEVGGTDATSAYEDVGHSEDATEIMHAYLVGVVEGAQGQDIVKSSSSPSANVQIVRRHSAETPQSLHSGFPNHVKEVAVLIVGAAGIMYWMSASHSLLSLTSTGVSDPQTRSRSFAQGFLVASGTLGLAGLIGATLLSKTINFSGGFSSYPSHVQSTSQKASTLRLKGVLNPSVYQKFRLGQKKELSDGIYKFVFDLPTKYSILGLPIGQHIAVSATIDDHTVVRSYTPVSNNRDLGRLELLIRVYPDGQVGNYLKNLNVGDFVDIRGPKGAMKYRRGMSKHLGMVGGGTGITPLFQVIRAICEDKNDSTKISLVYGNRSEGDILLRERLDYYAKTVPEKFQLHYVLDKPSSEWTGGTGHVTKEVLEKKMPQPTSDTKILLCGPPGMVNAMKKNLVELGFEGPGAVSKMSDQIFCF